VFFGKLFFFYFFIFLFFVLQMMDERGEDTFDTAFVKLKDIFLNADFYYDLAQLYKLFRGRSNTRPTDAKVCMLYDLYSAVGLHIPNSYAGKPNTWDPRYQKCRLKELGKGGGEGWADAKQFQEETYWTPQGGLTTAFKDWVIFFFSNS
jgi:hypothetical protein